MKNIKPLKSVIKKGQEKNWTLNSSLGIEISQKNREKMKKMKDEGIPIKIILLEFNISKAQYYRLTNNAYDGPKSKGRKQHLDDHKRIEILQRIFEKFQKSNAILDFTKMKKKDFIPLLKSDPIIIQIEGQSNKSKSTNFFYPEFKRFQKLYKNNSLILQNYNSYFIAEPIQVQSPQHNSNNKLEIQQDTQSSFEQSETSSIYQDMTNDEQTNYQEQAQIFNHNENLQIFQNQNIYYRNQSCQPTQIGNLEFEQREASSNNKNHALLQTNYQEINQFQNNYEDLQIFQNQNQNISYDDQSYQTAQTNTSEQYSYQNDFEDSLVSQYLNFENNQELD